MEYKVILRVIEGPEMGKLFEFTEQAGFIVGRDRPGTYAHFRLSGNDSYVSRNHFLVDINAPDCYVKDVASLNGTFVVREVTTTGGLPKRTLFFLRGKDERDWLSFARYQAGQLRCESYDEVEQRIKLADDDVIVVGNTSLKVEISEEIPEVREGHPISEQAIQEARNILRCITCGKELPNEILMKEACTLGREDFLCPECSQKETKKPSPVADNVPCWGCGKDLTPLANGDGQADKFKEVALYWCAGCASSKQKKVAIAKIKNYRILDELGSGGFGVVYLAWDETTGRISALKLTKEKIKQNQKNLLRFKREVEIMKKLLHPHLVRLYDGVITEEENIFFSSEYLPEKSLADLLNKRYGGRMSYGQACYLISQALEGLSYFHDFGENEKYVHRDLKPENIFVRKDDKGKVVAKIGDFGLARSYVLHGGTITNPGEWAGTPPYLAPEQITNFKDAKPYTDVYAMGVSLYHLITGEFPYHFPKRKEMLEMISKGKEIRDPIDIILGDDKPMPVEKKVKDIPRDLAKAINKAIEKDTTKRFASADKFKEAIERFAICE